MDSDGDRGRGRGVRGRLGSTGWTRRARWRARPWTGLSPAPDGARGDVAIAIAGRAREAQGRGGESQGRPGGEGGARQAPRGRPEGGPRGIAQGIPGGDREGRSHPCGDAQEGGTHGAREFWQRRQPWPRAQGSAGPGLSPGPWPRARWARMARRARLRIAAAPVGAPTAAAPYRVPGPAGILTPASGLGPAAPRAGSSLDAARQTGACLPPRLLSPTVTTARLRARRMDSGAPEPATATTRMAGSRPAGPRSRLGVASPSSLGNGARAEFPVERHADREESVGLRPTDSFCLAHRRDPRLR